MIGIFGGAFDPPHLGHVELARRALDHFDLERLRVLVVAEPGHKPVVLPVETRLRLAELAFGALPRTEVEIDRHAYTVDFLRDERPKDAIFLIGADEYRDLATWKEADAILELVPLGVATRHGIEPANLRDGDRVRFFEIESPPISSRELRARAAAGELLDDLVPAPVAREIAAQGLYRARRLD